MKRLILSILSLAIALASSAAVFRGLPDKEKGWLSGFSFGIAIACIVI